MEQAAQAMENAEVALRAEPVVEHEVISGRELLGIYVQQQQAETPPPFPGMEEHKKNYTALMDIQYRKLDDIISNGGENLANLVAEEEDLMREAEESIQGSRDARNSWGAVDRDP